MLVPLVIIIIISSSSSSRRSSSSSSSSCSSSSSSSSVFYCKYLIRDRVYDPKTLSLKSPAVMRLVSPGKWRRVACQIGYRRFEGTCCPCQIWRQQVLRKRCDLSALLHAVTFLHTAVGILYYCRCSWLHFVSCLRNVPPWGACGDKMWLGRRRLIM